MQQPVSLKCPVRIRQEGLTLFISFGPEGLGREVAFASECVGHQKGSARFDGLHAGIEVVDVDVQELAIGNFRQVFKRLAGQVTR